MCRELKKYCSTHGRQKSLAKTCGVTPQAVTQWLNKAVPATRVLDVEKATGGVVTRHQLRPDIYPIEENKGAAA